MTSDSPQRDLRLVEAGPGMHVHPSAERRLAVEHWLLSTLPEQGRQRARTEWKTLAATLLPLGTLFSAVRLPRRVVYTVAQTDNPQMVDEFLAAALDDAPVICDPAGHRYYALVPANMPAQWPKTAAAWRTLGVDCLGRGAYMGVPKVDAVTLDPQAYASYWSVPMSSAAMLCEPLAVCRLIAVAARRLGTEGEA